MRKPTRADLTKAKDAVVAGSKAAGSSVSKSLDKGRDIVVSGSRTAVHKAAEGLSAGTTVVAVQSRALSERISEGLADAVDQVVQQKRSQWCKDGQIPPVVSGMDAIIAKYANLNAAVAGGVSLIPGPLGMAAAVPEIVMVLRNQVAMICDLTAAAGKSGMISKELVLGILLSSSGIVGIGLLTVHGGKVIVRRASLRAMQKIILLLGGNVTQKLLKSMVSKWLPIVGAIAMAAWARFSTKRLGEQARGILSQDLEFEGELDEEDVPTTDVAYEPPTSRQTELRIRILINLMRIDRQIRDEELEFIEGVIAEANLPSEVADALRAGMSGAACAPIPYEEFGQHPEESLALLVDMVALARRDGEYHPAERAYVRQVGERFGLHGDDLEALLGEG